MSPQMIVIEAMIAAAVGIGSSIFLRNTMDAIKLREAEKKLQRRNLKVKRMNTLKKLNQ